MKFQVSYNSSLSLKQMKIDNGEAVIVFNFPQTADISVKRKTYKVLHFLSFSILILSIRQMYNKLQDNSSI